VGRLSKYNAKKVTMFGITFDSKKEADRYLELRAMFDAKKIICLRTQVPYVVIEKTSKFRETKYYADFVYDLITESGPVLTVEDVKGYRKGVAYDLFKIKKKLMYLKYGIEVIEI